MRKKPVINLALKNKKGWTVLHEVVHPDAVEAKKNRSKYFDILMGKSSIQDFPIDINALDEEGKTLLHHAIASGK